MAKKITAPHSYDPGKGRPKEYLAYLNAREMAYLRSINGNNMERGPRGLPSFPPKDAIGSSSNAPSKSPASSGVGRDSSRGLGQGAGGTAIGRGPSGGGNLGGGGKGPGGPSGPNSSPSRAGGPSTGGGGKGPGGPSGPNSAPSGTRGVGGPSSPMGGQGPSFSRDTKAQQDAQVRDAIKAVKNTPAFRSDASSGGIRTLSVGPMGTPVNVGPRVTPTAPQKQFYERIAPGPSLSTSISSQFPSYKYSSPLTPGTSPEDMTRRAAVMNQIEQEMRDMGLINKPAVTRTGSPIDAGGIPTGGRPPGKTRGFSLASPAEAAISDPEEKILKVETFPESAGMSFTGNLPKKSKQFDERLMTNSEGITREFTSEQIDKLRPDVQKALSDSFQTPTYSPWGPTFNDFRIGKNPGSGLGGIDYLSGERTSYTPGDYEAYRNDGSITSEAPSEPTGEVYGPKYVDPKVQELMRDIDKRNKQGVRGIKSIPVLGRVFEGLDLGRGLITGKKTTEADADLKRAYMQGSPAQRAELEKKNPNLTKFAQMAGLEPQLPMSNYNDWRQRSFGTGGGSGGSTSITSQGGGTPDIGSGGKNEPIRVKQAEKDTTKPKPNPKEDGRRPAIYYKWDLGVSVPSPTDSDYTLYLKYLQEKAAAKAAVA